MGIPEVIVTVPYYSRSGDLEKKYLPQMRDNEYSSSDIFIMISSSKLHLSLASREKADKCFQYKS